MSLYSLNELIPPFVSANNTGNLVNSVFVVSILIPVPSFTSFSWLPASLYMGSKSAYSSFLKNLL